LNRAGDGFGQIAQCRNMDRQGRREGRGHIPRRVSGKAPWKRGRAVRHGPSRKVITGGSTMSQYGFDERNIRWKNIDGVDHMLLSVLDVDKANGVLHVIYKFAAKRQIILHRHLTLNKTMTLRGEHRLYHADGTLKEVRPAGRFTVAQPSSEPHREGGGDVDAIVLFVVYGDGVLYEALDDGMNVIRTLTAADFAGLYDEKRD
jgi:hypothetical protein